MKQIICIFISLIFLSISGCDKNKRLKKVEKEMEKEGIAKLITESVIDYTNNKTDINNLTVKTTITEETNIQKSYYALNQNTNKIENIPIESKTEISDIPAIDNTKVSKAIDYTVSNIKEQEKNKINDRKQELSDNVILKTEEEKVTKKEKKVSERNIVNKSGKSFIIVGNNKDNQLVSPRKYIKITALAITSNKNAKTVDFKIIAVPKNMKLNKSFDYVIAYACNIEIINNQAQLTKYWNGLNYHKVFLPVGEYSIYFIYTFKDNNNNILYIEEKYWKNDKSYSIILK